MRWVSCSLFFILLAPLSAQTNDTATSTDRVVSLPTLRPGLISSTNTSFRELDILLPDSLRETRRHVIQSQSEKAAADFLAQGDAAEAVKAYRALELSLQNKPANQCGLALALMGTDNYLEAEKLLLSLAKADPQEPVYLNNLAWLYATASDVSVRSAKRALLHARRALQLAPRDPRVWHTLSEAYFIDEQYEEAVRRVKQAIELANVAPFDMQLPEFEAQLKKCVNAARLLPMLRK